MTCCHTERLTASSGVEVFVNNNIAMLYDLVNGRAVRIDKHVATCLATPQGLDVSHVLSKCGSEESKAEAQRYFDWLTTNGYCVRRRLPPRAGYRLPLTGFRSTPQSGLRLIVIEALAFVSRPDLIKTVISDAKNIHGCKAILISVLGVDSDPCLEALFQLLDECRKVNIFHAVLCDSPAFALEAAGIGVHTVLNAECGRGNQLAESDSELWKYLHIVDDCTGVLDTTAIAFHGWKLLQIRSPDYGIIHILANGDVSPSVGDFTSIVGNVHIDNLTALSRRLEKCASWTVPRENRPFCDRCELVRGCFHPTSLRDDPKDELSAPLSCRVARTRGALRKNSSKLSATDDSGHDACRKLYAGYASSGHVSVEYLASHADDAEHSARDVCDLIYAFSRYFEVDTPLAINYKQVSGAIASQLDNDFSSSVHGLTSGRRGRDTIYLDIQSPHALHIHELVHAVLWIHRGSPHLFIREGAASVFGICALGRNTQPDRSATTFIDAFHKIPVARVVAEALAPRSSTIDASIHRLAYIHADKNLTKLTDVRLWAALSTTANVSSSEYLLWGSFCRYIADEFGPDTLKRLYSVQPGLYESFFGRQSYSLGSAFCEWREWLLKSGFSNWEQYL